ncbi:MAG: NACHT domain-containing protein, partial [Bacteroidota bacterium]
MEKSELAKNILMTATPLVSAITEIFVKPKLADIAKGLKLKVNKIESIFEDKFNEYLTRSYEKYSIMNTIVFHNQQRLLKDLYIPLTLENTDQEQFTIDRFDKNFLPVYERILITDTAGMGKSTLLKKIFLSVIDEAVGIPILVELRRISKSKDIIQEIMDQINSISKDLDKDFILRLIQQGNFVFLFDGYDEIPTENRVEATEQIQKFINKAGKNLFILTSRPESALSAFGDFKGFSVKPLAKNQAFDLLRRYDGNGNLSKELIKKLQGKTYNNIDEFITNPLLVSLLFAAFEHKHTIPIKKHIFYRQVYDALFESHDLTKGDSFAREKFCKLDVDEFHRVLRHIGYNCLIKGKIEFTKDEILDLIKDAKTYVSGISFKESDLLKDLISTVPLFTIDGIYYKWSHKSLQEYFAAQFIFLDSKEKQRDILLKIYKHENAIKFINVLDLYYSIDYRSFSET